MKIPKRQEINVGYHTPLQIPVRWQDEQSGVLPAAVKSYLSTRIDNDLSLITEEEIELVRAYLEYYINAPCWNLAAEEAESRRDIANLRSDIVEAHSLSAIKAWLGRALDMGMDPL